MVELAPETVDEVVVRALGVELRRVREGLGWTQVETVSRLSFSGPTLWTYEHGERNCTVARLLEWCRALGVSAPEMLQAAVQRSGVDVELLVLRVDLRAVVGDRTAKFGPIVRWARNRLAAEPDGSSVVRVVPDSVRELAAVVGCSHAALVEYLTGFMPPVTPTTPVTPACQAPASTTAPGVGCGSEATPD